MIQMGMACALLASLALLGHGVLSLLVRRSELPLHTWCALTFGLGAGTVGVLLFWLSLAGLAPTRECVLAVAASGVVAAAALHAHGHTVVPRLPQCRAKPWPDRALAALLLIPIAWMAVETLSQPFHNIDAIAIWGLKAKVVALEPVRRAAYFTDVSRSFSHLDYPLLLPFLTAAVYTLTGTWAEHLAKMIHLAFFVSFVLLVYSQVRRRVSCRAALALLLVYVGSRRLLTQCGAGIADLLVMFYYFGAVSFLHDWAASRSRSSLAIGAAMNAFLMFTKNEGLALGMVNMAVFGALAWSPSRRAAARTACLALLAGLAMNMPWLIFRAGLPKTHENYMGRLRIDILADNVQRIGPIAAAFGKSLCSWASWGGLWALLAAAAFLGARSTRGRPICILWGLLLLHVGCYGVVMIVTPWDVSELLAIKTFPLLLQASPLVPLIIAEHWAVSADNNQQPIAETDAPDGATN